jgi:hypothetical protein
MFNYSKHHRCLFCDKIIVNNKNMVRIYPDKCFHLICDRKLSELRINPNYISRNKIKI